VLFHKVWELVRFQTAKVTFKVIQGNGIQDIQVFHCNYVFISHHFRDIITYLLKIKEVTRHSAHNIMIALVHHCINQHTKLEVPNNCKDMMGLNLKKISPGLTVDSLQLTFLPTSKSHDTETRTNITNPARTSVDIVP